MNAKNKQIDVFKLVQTLLDHIRAPATVAIVFKAMGIRAMVNLKSSKCTADSI
jgi:hypothetical protein